MSIFTDNEQRKVFVEVVEENIVGPGACKEVFKCNEDLRDEIINTNPVDQYYSGMIFPEIQEQSDSELVDEDNQFIPEDEEEEELDVNDGEEESDSEDTGNDDARSSDQGRQEWQARYYPNNFGLIFCVDENATTINVQFSYAKYSRISDLTRVKIRIGDSEQEFLQNKEALINFVENLDQSNAYEVFEHGTINKLQDVLCYSDDERCISLSSRPQRNEMNTEDAIIQTNYSRADIALLFKKYKEIAENPDEAIPGVISDKLPFLFEDNYFQREGFTTDTFPLDISGEFSDQTKRSIEGNDDISYRCKVFQRTKNNLTKKYVKLLLENNLPWELPSDGGSSSRGWKLRTLFQPEIKVESEHFSNYKDLLVNSIDEENTKTEYLYREEKSYGKGIGCAIEWDESNDTKWLKSSFLPKTYTRDFSNEIDHKLEGTENTLKLKNISSLTNPDEDKLLSGLKEFVDRFELWYEEQVEEARTEPSFEPVYAEILLKQEEQLQRLRDNITYLKENPEAQECFKIANTAMYLQMLVARSPMFRKNRDLSDYGEHNFKNIEYFENLDFAENPKLEPAYRPFQLAFLLMNVKPTLESNDPFREKVDLIWFPTGGGKTEAYLALTALTIIARRRNSSDDKATGVSVIMRYTLRLLTAQQFERATYLICALEFLRNKVPDTNLGAKKISIGMWVGGSTTPNRTLMLKQTDNKYGKFLNELVETQNSSELPKLQNKNPFPISYCPWCGCKLITSSEGILNGYYDNGKLDCMNPECHFHEEGLPVYYIDDLIYNNPPTLLFGTVDKFANLTNEHGHKLFNSRPDDQGKSPDLIIQDELHLISGPLGSMVGLFESLIEIMATKGGRKPKIIASTATTRNTQHLVRKLYNRDVVIFPAQGIKYSDNFFSRADLNSLKRMHVGIIPVGHTAAMTEIKLVALQIIARIKLFRIYLKKYQNIQDLSNIQEIAERLFPENNKLINDLDNYWTPVLFYNSLKDLGRTKSRIPQEIYESIRASINLIDFPDSLGFLLYSFYNRVSEFTSRENSSKIKSLLTKAESPILLESDEDRIFVRDGMDLIMASNMISVGIDISRLNVMLFAGQPRSVSEYIQSSSRVARAHKGVVFNLLNANRVRELSLFENYTSFHKIYYMYVEPLSATPFTEATVDRLLANILISYVRHVAGLEADQIREFDINPLMQFLKSRCSSSRQEAYVEQRLFELKETWTTLVEEGTVVQYKYFDSGSEGELRLMKSLRSIDPDCFTKIKGVK